MWANPGLICFFGLFSFQHQKQFKFYYLKCIDGVLGTRTRGPQDGRRRRNHRAIGYAPRKTVMKKNYA